MVVAIGIKVSDYESILVDGIVLKMAIVNDFSLDEEN